MDELRSQRRAQGTGERLGEKQQIDPLIFQAEGTAGADKERAAEGHSEPPPKLSWGSGPSSIPPPAASSPPPRPSQPSPDPTSERAIARVKTPRGILALGAQFGVYRIGTCIGEGGMARVYQAEHTGLQRQVALKVLTDGAVGPGAASHERFLREARIAAAIKHPNVVNIFDVGVHDGIPYLVMELLAGTDLESLITKQGALDESFLVDIMIPVVAGLAVVHDAGIVHRDLKPGNIFLATGRYEEVEPKLLDFGISRATGAEQLRLTTNGLLVGTPFYMSPEGLRGEDMTPKSDQYSLGVVMYECATGNNPFHASTFAEIFQMIGSATFATPSTARPQISKRLERIILKAMSLDPADRFADLRELGRELLLLAGQRTKVTWALSFGDIPRTTLANSLPRVDGARRRSSRIGRARWPLVLLLAFAGTSLGLVIFLWLVPGTPPRPPEAPVGVVAASPPPSFRSLVAEAPEPPASAHASAAEAAPPRLRHVARLAGNARRPTAPPISETGPDGDLKWAVPAANPPSSSASPSSNRTGTNGAPIFE
jgi:serine/threonine protein kinase